MGALLAILSAVLAAPLGLLSALPAREGVGAAELAFWRAALAWPLFALHARVTRAPPLDRRGLAASIGLGAAGLAALYCTYQVALREAGVLLGTALAESAPLLVVPLARLLLGERLSRGRLLGCGLALAGLLCVCGEALGGPLGLRPLLAGLLASAVYALFYVGSALASAGRAPARVLAAAMPAAALVLLPGARLAPRSAAACASMGLLALACTYGSYLAKTEALARIGAARVAALGTLEPVLASLLAVLVLHEVAGPAFVVGLALELLGLLLLAWPAARTAGAGPGSASSPG